MIQYFVEEDSETKSSKDSKKIGFRTQGDCDETDIAAVRSAMRYAEAPSGVAVKTEPPIQLSEIEKWH